METFYRLKKTMKKLKTLFLIIGLFAFAFQVQAADAIPTLVTYFGGNPCTTICTGQTVTFAITTPTPSTYYKLKKDGSIIAAGTSDALGGTLNFIGISDGAGTYTTTPTTTTVVVSNGTPSAPTGPTGQTFCAGTVANLLPAICTGIKWYTSATGTVPLTSTGALSTANYYAEQVVGSCTSLTRLVTAVTSNAIPSAPSGPTGQIHCSGTVADLDPLGTTGVIISWYATSTGVTVLPTSTPLFEGVANYYASKTILGCESTGRLTSTVTGVITPAVPTGEAVQTFCYTASGPTGTVANLVALGATGATFSWYLYATTGTVLASTGILVNATDYYASQTISTCESATRFKVTTIVNSTLTAPSGPTDRTFCYTASPTVADLNSGMTGASGASFAWYMGSTGGTGLSTSTALVTATHYYASQSTAGCGESTSRFPVLVTITTSLPSVPTGTAIQTLCTGATIADLTATGTDIKWYASASGGGSPLASSYVLANNTHYHASQTVGTCESATRLDVLTALTALPSAPTGSTGQTFCNAGTVADLTAVGATGSTIKWYLASSGGTALSGSTGLVAGNYYASQTVGTCESSLRFTLPVTINIPTAPTGSTGQQFCNGTVADLVIADESYDPIYKWYTSATGGTALAPTGALVNATDYYASQTTGGTGPLSCESIGRYKTTVTNTSLLITNPAPLCEPYTVDLTDPAVTYGSILHGSTLTYWTNPTCDGTGTLVDPDVVAHAGTYYIKSDNGVYKSDPYHCAIIKPVVVTLTVNCPKTWTGAVSSYWSVDGNWEPSGVPMRLNDVTIPVGPINMPNVDVNPAECHDFTIADGANLTITPGNALTVYGAASLSGAECLIINTEGSYIDQLPSKAGGTAKVEKTLTGNGRAWYLGSPMSSAVTAGSVYPTLQPASNPGVGIHLKKWLEPTQVYSEISYYANIDSLPLTGYNVRNYGVDDIHATFIGTLNTGDITRSGLTNSGLGGSPGYNLVCNPYPSALDWGTVHSGLGYTSTNLDPTIWYRTSGVFATYNPSGNGGYGVGTNGGSKEMPAMQSFWVSVSTGHPTGSLTIKQSARIHTTRPFFKEVNESNVFRMEALRDGLKDETVLTFNDGVSSEYDQSDSKKMFTDENDYPQIFTLTSDNVKVAINGLPELTSSEVYTVPLGFTSNVVGTCTLNATNLDGFIPDAKVYLEDAQQNVIQDLRQTSTYTFTSGVVDDANRFKLHFTLSPLGMSDSYSTSVTSYSYNNTIYVNISAAGTGTIELFNVLGEKIISQQSVKGLNKLQTNLSKGVYIVKVQNGANVVTEKVMIDK